MKLNITSLAPKTSDTMQKIVAIKSNNVFTSYVIRDCCENTFDPQLVTVTYG